MLKIVMMLTAAIGGQATTRPAAELGPAYVDASYRFSVRPPREWGMNVQRTMAPGEVLLLEMDDPIPVPFRPEIAVKWSSLPRTATVADFIERFHRSLMEKAKDLTILTDGPRLISGRRGAVFAAQYTLMRRPVLQMIAVVQAGPGGFYSLTFTGPCGDTRAAAQKVFDDVVASFKLLGDESSDAALRAALKRTAAWLDGLKNVRLADKIQPPLWLRVTIDGQERGMIVVREEPYSMQHTDGVRVQESGWTFPESGQAERSENNLFVSLDRTVEAWETQSLTLLPASTKQSASLALSHEEGLRDHDLLLTSQNYALGKTPVNNPPIRLPDGYVSRLLLRWLPRLTDVTKPALYAATAYDHRKGGLVLRTVEMAGPAGPGVYRVLDREGLGAQPVELLVDANGRLMSMTAGAVRMDPADGDALQRRWASRTAAAAKQIDELSREYQNAESRFAPPPAEETKKPRAGAMPESGPR